MTYKNKIFLLIFCLMLSSCAKTMEMLPWSKTDNEVQIWLEKLQNKSSAEQIEIASQAYTDENISNNVRERATFILASHFNSQSSLAMQELEKRYNFATVEKKIVIEDTMYADLQKTTDANIKQLLGLIKPEQEFIFPYNIVIYEAAKRNLLQNSAKIISTLTSNKFFKSPKLGGIAVPIDDSKPISSGSIAILLPRSGNIAPISNQIIAGLEAAKSYLQSQKMDWKIHYIDTTQANWHEQVRNLPKDCITVGGPIQTVNYNLLKDNNLLEKRAVFAFLPRLSVPSDEGYVAWQFFTKPEDQISAMLNVASNQLGIKSFGVFAPANSYGSSMDTLFTQIALTQGLNVESAFYPTDDIQAWANSTKDFLMASVPEDNKTLPEIHANFDAIFFPASWRDMDQLISTMHYQGAYDKVMLGTLLWEQSLNQAQNINPKTFALTLFPVAYEPNLDTELNTKYKALLAQAGVQINDWTALGFDFLLMAGKLGLDQRLHASQINSRLQNLNAEFVSAPFQWDFQGISHRQLFINQPARIGRVPFDLNRFIEYRNNGRVLPNDSPEPQVSHSLQVQEQEALKQIDSLINEILED